ncbi:hypothetical protein GGQ54_002239 [Naumannella cuiyingiana]|uniref:YCII-related domain-containing protein n=1 Tax=Naumannella cuiyingiana TaxID=1347891 RepID=A0A7Z0DAB4_9ACTN|nr:YciI family protein [Naumannella cuiyingiana]NYI71679.1 hypothetical protein [Naumannella cuiyingiana]
MAVFALIYRYTDETDRRMEVRPRHREYLAGLAEQGTVLVAGAFADESAPGGLIIVRAGSDAEVENLVQGDPYQEAGVIAGYAIREWAPPIGPLAGEFAGG